jgi:hypothetical protein
MVKILEDDGIELYKDNNKYFLRYDAGELMIKMKNLQILEQEAERVIENPDSAYEIIIGYQNKGIYGEDA